MNAVPTVYLARHGETAWSKTGQHTGHTDIPLTATGEDDARKLGTRLAGISFARVFSSPLSRAKRTAELAGFTPETVPDLLEWNYGDYEGKTSAEIRQQRPDWLLFRDGCPGGESPADVANRTDRFVVSLKRLTGNVLCFAHGHVLRVLAARWVGQPIAFASRLLLGTATLSVLSFDHGRLDEPAIRVWNAS
jgi:probable phosphoglycerate mutase